MNTRTPLIFTLTLAAALAGPATAALAAREAKERPDDPAAAEGDFAANRLLQRAQDLLTAGEHDRGVKMLETVADQYPASDVRFAAYLALGRHHLDTGNYQAAIDYLGRLQSLDRREQPLPDDLRETFLEGLYLLGQAYYKSQQFTSAFPVLRKITRDHPNTVWANQAYYYIGMCHFAQGNWNKAIDALNLVGTFVDPASPTVDYVEAGRRFYTKIEDDDLPVLRSLGREVDVTVTSESGDREIVRAVPLTGGSGGKLYIASLATELGEATAGDSTLQVRGGDALTVSYVDDNTQAGKKDVPREKRVRVVSTGALQFTQGTFEDAAYAAFLNQPLAVVLTDADEDTSDGADEVRVRIVSQYKERIDEDEAATQAGEDPDSLRAVLGIGSEDREKERWVVRDEATLTLTELGEKQAGGVHSGRFAARIDIAPFREGDGVDTDDANLTAATGDTILATYVDELHIDGQTPRPVEAKIEVAGEIDTGVSARQPIVTDDVLRSRKFLVEATALLELARIFRSMGLVDGAEEKAHEGLDRVDPVIAMATPLPTALKEQAFELKWELYIVQGEYDRAIETCRLFNSLYPESPLVDRALMGIARIKLEEEAFGEAIEVYEQVLALPQSNAKAEAQFNIAEAMEQRAMTRVAQRKDNPQFTLKDAEDAVQAYRQTATQYPDSEFAGPALSKLVDYHVATRDFVQAVNLLEQTFRDYPDAAFLDSLLLKWMVVAYRMGDLQTSVDRGQRLVLEYPGSPHAAKAKELLPQIEARLKGSGAGGSTSNTPSSQDTDAEANNDAP